MSSQEWSDEDAGTDFYSFRSEGLGIEHKDFYGLFLDEWVGDIEKGGVGQPPTYFFERYLPDILKDRENLLQEFKTDEECKVVKRVIEGFRKGASLHFGDIKNFRKVLHDLKPPRKGKDTGGDFIMLKVGWLNLHCVSSHCVSYIFERMSNGKIKVSYHDGNGPNAKSSDFGLIKTRGNSLIMWEIDDSNLAEIGWAFNFLKCCQVASEMHGKWNHANHLLPTIGRTPSGSNVENLFHRFDHDNDFITGQKGPTCFFKGPAAGLRYMHRRGGLTARHWKNIMYAIRYMALKDLSNRLQRSLAGATLVPDMQVSADSAEIEYMVRRLTTQGLRAHAKNMISDKHLAEMNALCDNIKRQLEAFQDDYEDLPAPLRLEQESTIVSKSVATFNDLSWLSNREFDFLAEAFKGSELEEGKLPTVDFSIIRDNTVTSFAQALDAMRLCKRICESVDKRLKKDQSRVVLIQKGALLKHVALSVLPQPKPHNLQEAQTDAVWGFESASGLQNLDTAVRRECLGLVYDLCRHWLAYLHSNPTDPTMQAERSIVMTAFFIIYDTVVRKQTSTKEEEARALEKKGSQRQPSYDLQMAGYLNGTNGFITKLSCEPFYDGPHKAGDKEGKKSYMTIYDKAVVMSPTLVIRRDLQLRYLEAAPTSAGSRGLTDSEVREATTGTILHMDPAASLAKSSIAMSTYVPCNPCGVPFPLCSMHMLNIVRSVCSLVGHKFKEENEQLKRVKETSKFSHASELEFMASWLHVIGFQELEFAEMRNMVLLLKLSMECDCFHPHAPNRVDGRIVYAHDIDPEFIFSKTDNQWQPNKAKGSYVCFDIKLLGRNPYNVGNKNLYMTENVLAGIVGHIRPSIDPMQPFNDGPSEDDVLQMSNLPTFNHALSQEDSELLHSFLTAPYLRIPLILDFFASNRVGSLFDPQLQELLQAVLFSPGEWTGTLKNEQARVSVVPCVDPTHFNSSFGQLVNEIEHSPEAVLGPLLAILREVVKISLGDYQSGYVPLVLFMVRMAVYVEGFVLAVLQQSKEPSGSSLSASEFVLSQIEAYLDALTTIVRKDINGIIQRWIREAELAHNSAIALRLHAHAALTHKNLQGRGMNTEQVSGLLGSISYVQTWYRHQIAIKSSTQWEEIEAEKDRLANDIIVPEALLYETLQEQRCGIAKFLSKLKSKDLDACLGRIVQISIGNPLFQCGNWTHQATEGEGSEPLRFISGSGKVELDVSTCEVFMNAKELLPCPDTMVGQQEFIDVFGNSVPHCVTKSRHADMHHVTCWYKDTEYDLYLFEPTHGRRFGDSSSETWQCDWLLPAERYAMLDLPQSEKGALRAEESHYPDFPFPVADLLGSLSGESQGQSAPAVVRYQGVEYEGAMDNPSDQSEFEKQILSKRMRLQFSKSAPGRDRIEDFDQLKSMMNRREASHTWRIVFLDAKYREVYLRRLMICSSHDGDKFEEIVIPAGQVTYSGDKGTQTDPDGTVFVDNDKFIAIGQWGDDVDETNVQQPAKFYVEIKAKKAFSIRSVFAMIMGKGPPFGALEVRIFDEDTQLWRAAFRAKVTHPQLVRGVWVDSELPVRDKDSSLEEADSQASFDRIKSDPMFVKYKWLYYFVKIRFAAMECFSLGVTANFKNAESLDYDGHRLYFPKNFDPDTAEVGTVLMHYANYDCGEWIELQVCKSSRTVNAFRLVQHGRKVYRVQTWSSDDRFSLADFHLPTMPISEDHEIPQEKSKSPRPLCVAHENGNFSPEPNVFDPRSGAGRTLVIRRSGVESYVPSDCLYGVLPTALSENMQFWLINATSTVESMRDKPLGPGIAPCRSVCRMMKHVDVLHGLPRAGRRTKKVSLGEQLGNTMFRPRRDVSLAKVPLDYPVEVWVPAEKWQTPAEDTPWPPSPRKQGIIKRVDAQRGTERWLINLLQAPAGGGVARLAKLIARLDTFAYVLTWSEEKPVVDEKNIDVDTYQLDDWDQTAELKIGLIECPRIKASFHPVTGVDGVLRLYSVDYPEFFVSDFRSQQMNDLLKGLPHVILLESLAGAFKMMMPSFDLWRPTCESAPLHKFVRAVRRSENWTDSVTDKHYIYDVHSSKYFCIPTTLAGALYLVYVKICTRDIRGAFAIMDSCQSDMALAPEELHHIIKTLNFDGFRNYETLPEYEGVYKKLSVKFMHLTGKLPGHVAAYLFFGGPDIYFKKKETHKVPTWAQLSPSEERLFLDKYYYCAGKEFQKGFIDGVADARAGKEVDVKDDRDPNTTTNVIHNIRWPAGRDSVQFLQTHFMDHFEDQFKKKNNELFCRKISYERPNMREDHQVTKALLSLSEDSWVEWNGAEYKTGFFFLYELLAGHLRADFQGNKDCGFSLGYNAAVAKYNGETRGGEVEMDNGPYGLFVMLGIVASNPDKDWPKVDDHMLSVLSDCGLPNYQRNHERVPYAGAKEGAGLLEWFEILLKMCTGKDIVMKATPWSIPFADEEAQAEYEKKVNTSISAWERDAEAAASQGDLVDKGDAVREIATIMRPFPEQQHFDCSQRSIAFSPELMESFGGKPNVALLEELGGGLERFVHREFRDDRRQEVEEEVDSETSMPFTDISRHPSTQAPIAKDMLRRWQADIKKYKVQSKTSMRSALRGLGGQDANSCPEDTVVRSAQEILAALNAMRAPEEERYEQLVKDIAHIADHVEVRKNMPDLTARLTFLIQRHHSQGAMHTWHEFRCRQLMAPDLTAGIRSINPFLSDADGKKLEQYIIEMMLRGNRLVLIDVCRDLSMRVVAAAHRKQSTTDPKDLADARKDLSQTVSELSGRLCTQRWYMHEDGTFDPRFLVFEYAFDMVLRRRQVEIIHEIVAEARGNSSAVHQMIMGAGKTTVISPLASLILANGERSMVQVVPDPLLHFSTAVARRCFNNIIAKNVYTMRFQRSAPLKGDEFEILSAKLSRAQERGDLIVTTPATLKSFMLKFTELQLILSKKIESKAVSTRTDDLERIFPAGKLISSNQGEKMYPDRTTSQYTRCSRISIYGGTRNEREGNDNLLSEEGVGSTGSIFMKVCFDMDVLPDYPKPGPVPEGGTEGKVDMRWSLWLGPYSMARRKEKDVTHGYRRAVEGRFWVNSSTDFCEGPNCIFDRAHNRVTCVIEKDAVKQVLNVGEGVYWMAILRDEVTRETVISGNPRPLVEASPEVMQRIDAGGVGVKQGGSSGSDDMSYENLCDCSHWMAKSLSVMQNYGCLLLDEVDLIMHPLHSELNFPIGPKTLLQPAPYRWEIVVHLMDAIFFATTGAMSDDTYLVKGKPVLRAIKRAIEQGKELKTILTSPHIVLLDAAWFSKTMKPPLAQWMLLWIRDRFDFHENITDEVLFNYISAPSLQKRQEAADYLEGRCLGLAMQMLNLSSDWLKGFMAHTMAKVNRVSFGLLLDEDLSHVSKEDIDKMPGGRLQLAIPFTGKDRPSDAAEFAHPDVLIGLTTLAYRYNGLRLEDVRRIVEQLKLDLTSEPGPLETRPSKQRFASWLAEGIERHNASPACREGTEKMMVMRDFLPLELFQLNDDKELTKVWKLVKMSPSVIRYHLLSTAFPGFLMEQRQKISASGQDLGSSILFKTRIGFSGTPSDLLPQDLKPCKFEPGSEGKIISTLTSVDFVEVETISDWNVRVLLDRIASGPYHALIDVGALITGLSNEEVARYLLDRGLKGLDACVFLDKFDRQMVVIRGQEGKALALETVGIPKNKRFTFYDAVHTTGIDIKQAPTAKAVLTLAKDTTLRDYAQGAWRMRGLGAGQTLRLYVIDEVLKLVHDNLGDLAQTTRDNATSAEMSAAGKTQQDIVAWLILNEVRIARLQNGKLLEQSTYETFREPAFKAITNEYMSTGGDSVDTAARSLDISWDVDDVNYLMNEHGGDWQPTDKVNARFTQPSVPVTQSRSRYAFNATGVIKTAFVLRLTEAQKRLPREQTHTVYIAGTINARNSQPLVLLANGKEVSRSFLEETTGDWDDPNKVRSFTHGPFLLPPSQHKDAEGNEVILLEMRPVGKDGPWLYGLRVHSEQNPGPENKDQCLGAGRGFYMAHLQPMPLDGVRGFQLLFDIEKREVQNFAFEGPLDLFVSGSPDAIRWCFNQIKKDKRKKFVNICFPSKHVMRGYTMTFDVANEKLLNAIPSSWKLQARTGDTGDKNGAEDSKDWVTIDERTSDGLKWKQGDFDYIGTDGKKNSRPEKRYRTIAFLIGHHPHEGIPPATADAWDRAPPPLSKIQTASVEASDYRIIVGSSLGSDTLNTIPSSESEKTVAIISSMNFFTSRADPVAGINYEKLPKVRDGVGLFLENVNNDVSKSIPEVIRLHDRLDSYVTEHSNMLVPGQRENIDKLLAELDAGNSSADKNEGSPNMQAHTLDAEMTREQEQEQELQQEQEAEEEQLQDTEYARDVSSSHFWRLETLLENDGRNVLVRDANPLSLDFQTRDRYKLCRDAWGREATDGVGTVLAEQATDVLYSLNKFTMPTVSHELPIADFVHVSDNIAKRKFVGTGQRVLPNLTISLEWYDRGGEGDDEHINVCAVTLAEACALRLYIHQAMMRPRESSKVNYCLRLLQSGRLLDSTPNFTLGTSLRASMGRQALRFFNCDFTYLDANLKLLETALHGIEHRKRIAWFLGCLLCRKRSKQNIKRSTIAPIVLEDGHVDEVADIDSAWACSLCGIFNEGKVDYCHICNAPSTKLAEDLDGDGKIDAEEYRAALLQRQRGKVLQRQRNDRRDDDALPDAAATTASADEALVVDAYASRAKDLTSHVEAAINAEPLQLPADRDLDFEDVRAARRVEEDALDAIMRGEGVFAERWELTYEGTYKTERKERKYAITGPQEGPWKHSRWASEDDVDWSLVFQNFVKELDQKKQSKGYLGFFDAHSEKWGIRELAYVKNVGEPRRHYHLCEELPETNEAGVFKFRPTFVLDSTGRPMNKEAIQCFAVNGAGFSIYKLNKVVVTIEDLEAEDARRAQTQAALLAEAAAHPFDVQWFHTENVVNKKLKHEPALDDLGNECGCTRLKHECWVEYSFVLPDDLPPGSLAYIWLQFMHQAGGHEQDFALMWINGELMQSCVMERDTSEGYGWDDPDLRLWYRYGPFPVKAGTNTLKLEGRQDGPRLYKLGVIDLSKSQPAGSLDWQVPMLYDGSKDGDYSNYDLGQVTPQETVSSPYNPLTQSLPESQIEMLVDSFSAEENRCPQCDRRSGWTSRDGLGRWSGYLENKCKKPVMGWVVDVPRDSVKTYIWVKYNATTPLPMRFFLNPSDEQLDYLLDDHQEYNVAKNKEEGFGVPGDKPYPWEEFVTAYPCLGKLSGKPSWVRHGHCRGEGNARWDRMGPFDLKQGQNRLYFAPDVRIKHTPWIFRLCLTTDSGADAQRRMKPKEKPVPPTVPPATKQNDTDKDTSGDHATKSFGKVKIAPETVRTDDDEWGDKDNDGGGCCTIA